MMNDELRTICHSSFIIHHSSFSLRHSNTGNARASDKRAANSYLAHTTTHQRRQKMQAERMRAVVIMQHGGTEGLEVREVEKPVASGDHVRVRVRAAALNRADLLQRRGH